MLFIPCFVTVLDDSYCVCHVGHCYHIKKMFSLVLGYPIADGVRYVEPRHVLVHESAHSRHSWGYTHGWRTPDCRRNVWRRHGRIENTICWCITCQGCWNDVSGAQLYISPSLLVWCVFLVWISAINCQMGTIMLESLPLYCKHVPCTKNEPFLAPSFKSSLCVSLSLSLHTFLLCPPVLHCTQYRYGYGTSLDHSCPLSHPLHYVKASAYILIRWHTQWRSILLQMQT